MTTYYRVMDGLKSCHGGSFTYGAPHGKRPGTWTPRILNTKACVCGYHVVEASAISDWIDRSNLTVWEVEADGMTAHDSKFVCERVRLIRKVGVLDNRTARILACDFAEMSLPIFEKAYPKDKRPREAIEIARRFAVGEAPGDELAAARDAAWDAAWDAAGDAVRTAAWDAARTKQGERILARLGEQS